MEKISFLNLAHKKFSCQENYSYLIYSSKLPLKDGIKAIKQLITTICDFDFPLFSVESPWFLYYLPFNVVSSHFSEHVSNIHIHFLSIQQH